MGKKPVSASRLAGKHRHVPCELITGCGGGGNQEKLPASRGVLPKITNMQITPPSTHVMNLAPKLPVEETIVAPNVELPRQEGPLGDPFHGVNGLPPTVPVTAAASAADVAGALGISPDPAPVTEIPMYESSRAAFGPRVPSSRRIPITRKKAARSRRRAS